MGERRMTMTDNFSEKVANIVGPLLSSLGFTLDAVDDDVDEGGRRGSVVYYRADDCKIQIYWSPRAGEINCMIAPIDAPNEPGLYDRSGKWHYLNEFVEKPNLPLEELVKMLRSEKANFETTDKWLQWLRDRIQRYFGAAHSGILKLYE
jgi:hypothetical protein